MEFKWFDREHWVKETILAAIVVLLAVGVYSYYRYAAFHSELSRVNSRALVQEFTQMLVLKQCVKIKQAEDGTVICLHRDQGLTAMDVTTLFNGMSLTTTTLGAISSALDAWTKGAINDQDFIAVISVIMKAAELERDKVFRAPPKQQTEPPPHTTPAPKKKYI